MSLNGPMSLTIHFFLAIIPSEGDSKRIRLCLRSALKLEITDDNEPEEDFDLW